MEDAAAEIGRILRLARERGLTLREGSAVLDDTGWDFIVVHATADDGSPWILRVPRRADVTALARAEQQLLALLRGRFAISIPDWQLADAELIAYPRLAGEPAASEDPVTFQLHWRIDRADPPGQYVEALGQFMAELHRTAVAEAAAAGIPVRAPADVRSRFARQLDFGASELGIHGTWLDRGRRWLERDDLWADAMVLIHGDLHPGHTLVDDDGTLLGVLDWTDAEVGDPGQEFVEAARKFEPSMLDQLIDSYSRHGGPVWPGLRAHVVEAIAFAPLALGMLGVEAGKQRYIDNARSRLGVPTS
jgi:macrolide phosphotransferase